MKTAIISVSDKTGVVELANELIRQSFTIYSTGGTLKLLDDNGVKVKSIKSLTKFPEILDGRVKTLHPHIHGGILADKRKNEHISTCEEHGIKLIDLVVVNLYPFEETVAKKDVTADQAIEQIDIGGPTLIRAAAKNYHSIGVLTDPADYEACISELQKNKSELSLNARKELAIKAFKRIADYDLSIANYFLEQDTNQDTDSLPTYVTYNFEKINNLRYGENPHQIAAVYRKRNNHAEVLTQLHGKQLSYNNYLDIDAAISIVKEFDIPGAAIIKHTNPCGAAQDDSLHVAYKKAHDADSLSAFGSIVGLNRSVDLLTAQELSKTFIEVIVAPSFEKNALELLSKKANIRLIEVDFNKIESIQYQIKDLLSSTLIQSVDTKNISTKEFKVVTKQAPSQAQKLDLEFAFRLVKFIKSNAILIVKNGQTIGIGAGQMSRVDAVEIALKKAGENANGAVLASDAFFPFKDSVELCVKHGITSIIQPGGSKRDQESIDTCDNSKISMVFTGTRHFRH